MSAPTEGVTTNSWRYLDGLSGLFTVQVGHGRDELAEAAAKQAKELACLAVWTYAHPKAIEPAERLERYLGSADNDGATPEDLAPLLSGSVFPL